MIFCPAAFRPRVGLALLATAGLLPPTHLHAGPLCPEPEGRHVLQVRPPPPDRAHHCDLQSLARLPSRDIVTALPPALGMPGVHRWTGVPLRHLVEQLGGGKQSQIQLTALNDYSIQIPWSDLVRYDPILAYRRDGKPLGIRDKGPLILIYPFDAHPSLQAQEYLNRTIWQANGVFVH